jgi:hypothetical protein
MKEEWLFPNAVVPVDVETTTALVAEIHRLINVVGGMALAQQEPVAQYSDIVSDGGLDPRNKFDTPPAAQRHWVGLTDEERNTIGRHHAYVDNIIRATEAKLMRKNT